MKLYPIHILIKDLSLLIILFLSRKIPIHSDNFFVEEWLTIPELIGTSFYFSIGSIMIDLIIFSILYWALKIKKLQFRTFYFGVAVHIPILILIYMNLDLDNQLFNYLTAGIISTLISGYVYKKINPNSINLAFHQNDIKN